MPNTSSGRFEELVERLDRLMLPFAGKVAYGNLRTKLTEWSEDGATTENLAIIYESPGGSTNQVNIAYYPERGLFITVDPENGAETETAEIESLLDLVQRHIDTIPGYRLERLHQQIDEWVENGYSQPHVFAELNGLLQSDFRGGSITQAELQDGARYAVLALRKNAADG